MGEIHRQPLCRRNIYPICSICHLPWLGWHSRRELSSLIPDVAAAYALAIRWRVAGIAQYGDAAIRILDAWSSTLTALGGNSDLFLAAGIYGYEFAQAGEIMRSYTSWTGFVPFKNMMVNVFYSQINEWFVNHDAGTYGQYALGVYAGWDLSMMAGAVAIGILADNQTIYNQGANWFLTGTGNGQVFRVCTFEAPSMSRENADC